jgi:hypothetical protein
MTTEEAKRIMSMVCIDPDMAKRLHDDPEAELKVQLGVPANPLDIDFFRKLPPPTPGQTAPAPDFINKFKESIGEL